MKLEIEWEQGILFSPTRSNRFQNPFQTIHPFPYLFLFIDRILTMRHRQDVFQKSWETVSYSLHMLLFFFFFFQGRGFVRFRFAKEIIFLRFLKIIFSKKNLPYKKNNFLISHFQFFFCGRGRRICNGCFVISSIADINFFFRKQNK